MTTNKPEVVAWAPSLDLAKLSLNGGGRNGVGCILTDGPTPHGNDVAMVRLSDYEALQAECEELKQALAESRANDQQAMAYLNEVRAIVGGDDFPDMVRRCEKLRKEGGLIRALSEILPALDEALEDLEIHGLHSDRGYVKLRAWYRQMIRTTNAIDAAMQENKP